VIVAEFLFIAFVVGILTETWLGFLGTFFGLYALYRFPTLCGPVARPEPLLGPARLPPGRLQR
jgi:hypothetical protein